VCFLLCFFVGVVIDYTADLELLLIVLSLCLPFDVILDYLFCFLLSADLKDFLLF